MRHVMKSLKHNGIMVPVYEPKGFSVMLNGHKIMLREKSEQMAVAWMRRNLSTTITPPDAVFKKNFMKAFLSQLKQENPSAPIPNDLVTTSGSGLDPDITPAGAAAQVARVAQARHVAPAEIERLVAAATEGRTLGVIGEARVNVLKLNLALDALPAR